MGILEQVIGDVVSGSGNSGSPIEGMLLNMLGGGQTSPMNTGSASQTMPAQGNGLPGIISAFEQAGLGHIVQSWIGNGQNIPVSPQQLQSVLGEGQVNSMASQAGMPKEDFLSQLSQHLPAAVNGLTPNGALPDGSISI